MKYRLILAIILMLWPTVNGHAQTTDIPTEFRTYITTNQNYTDALDSKYKNIFHYIFSQCEEDPEIRRLKPHSLLAVKFLPSQDDDVENENEAVNPHSGQWIERAVVTGCKTASQLNMLVTAYDSENMPLLFPLLNGKTRISPLHQSFAEKAVYDFLVQDKSCRAENIVKNSLFLGYRSEANNSLSKDNNNMGWFEEWIVNACNTDHNLYVAILPDPKTKYRYIIRNKSISE